MSSQQISLLLVVVFVVLEYATITVAISKLRRRVHKLEVDAQPKDEQVSIDPLGLDFSDQIKLGNGDVLVGQAADDYRKAYKAWLARAGRVDTTDPYTNPAGGR